MSKRTLLLADDSVTIQKVVNLTFADEGIDVITVGDGDAAMEKISQMTPDVVLADVHMPGLSGYQICEILRENPVTKDLPVVLLVGSFEPFDESEAARVGANAYLTKPFQSIRQLVSQVTDLMGGAAAAEADTEEPVIPLKEAESERAPDTTDIESLYKQSVNDPSVAESDAGAPRYVDAGMDDEMIETSSVSAAFEEESSADDGSVTEMESDSDSPESGDAGYVEQPSHETYSDEVEAAAPESQSAEDAQPFDAYATDPNNAQAAAATAETSSHFDEFSRTEQMPAFDQSHGGGYHLDEIELLELPPIENGKTLEFTTTQRSIAQGSNKQVVSLSPELMEIIVAKVVEKLSEKY